MADNITDVQVCECVSSNYVQPRRLRFKQKGVARVWDYMVSHDSVCILLFNVTREVFVLVKQFRPALYAKKAQAFTVGETVDTSKNPGHTGFTYEFCAGIIDKENKSLAQIAKEEVWEECGYDVPLEKFERMLSGRGGVGITGSRQTYFYAEITDAMKKSEGGGIPEDGEMIEVVEIPLKSAHEFMWDETKEKPVGVMLGLMWFFQNKRPALAPTAL